MEKRDTKATVTHSFPMSGGEGTYSYARNSSLQRGGIFNALNKSKEAILMNLDLGNPYFDLNIFRIADFGCSVGPNTFDVVKHIIDTVELKSRQVNNMDDSIRDLEFHVFFNDQSDNDFNTLFKTLPKNEKYSAAGVPGSFYGRVFPRNSLHIGHTSYTLHWLSRVPENIGKLNSPAHKEQFKKDMEAFLEARSEELVPGGLMIILGVCISDGVPFAQTGKGIIKEIFFGSLMDIAKSGVISEEKAKSFNLPVYFPHFSEVKEAMERDRRFSIEMMEEIKHAYEDVHVSHDLVVSVYRGLYNGVLVQHFGEGLVDVLFDRFAKDLTKCPLDDIKKTASDREYVAVLKRNAL